MLKERAGRPRSEGFFVMRITSHGRPTARRVPEADHRRAELIETLQKLDAFRTTMSRLSKSSRRVPRATNTDEVVRRLRMESVSLANAKARLGELADRAAAGDTICITRGGKPVARLTAFAPPRAPVDFSAMRALTEAAPLQSEDAGDLVRRMRDEDRY